LELSASYDTIYYSLFFERHFFTWLSGHHTFFLLSIDDSGTGFLHINPALTFWVSQDIV
jgi:hypothetical protein